MIAFRSLRKKILGFGINMNEYEVAIDTQLKYGIITLTIYANNQKDAYNKAVKQCKELYKEDYEEDHRKNINNILKYRRFYKKYT